MLQGVWVSWGACVMNSSLIWVSQKFKGHRPHVCRGWEAPASFLRQLQSDGMSHLPSVCFQHGAGRVFSILWDRAFSQSVDLVCSGTLLLPSFPDVSPKGRMLWGWGCPTGKSRECVGPWPQHRTLSPIRGWRCSWQAQVVDFGTWLNGSYLVSKRLKFGL